MENQDLNVKELAQAVSELAGKEVAEKVKGIMSANEEKLKDLVNKNDFNKAIETTASDVEKVKGLLDKQGIAIEEVVSLIKEKNTPNKSLGEVMEENQEKIKSNLSNRANTEFEIVWDSKNKKAVARLKAAGITGTVDNLSAGSGSSILSQLSAATILRMGADEDTIIQIPRENTYIFDLCNTYTVNARKEVATWLEEVTREMNPAIVLEGGAKPISQTRFERRSSPYQKIAHKITMTEEFDYDFPRLVAVIESIGIQELMLAVQNDVITKLNASAQTFVAGDGTAFKSGGTISNINDYDALLAVISKIVLASEGSFVPNIAIVDFVKKYNLISANKETTGGYLQMPELLNDLRIIAGKGIATGNFLVGDLKRFNIEFRGGVQVRVGYGLQGTQALGYTDDFDNNRISTIIEQWYFAYNSNIENRAFVKGTFANVKTLLA